MSHGRKPRRSRVMNANPIGRAIGNVTKLSDAERETVMAPLRAAVAALRRGVGTEFDWQVAVSAVNVGDAIESLGVVRGLGGHLKEIDLALQGIRQRAMASASWRSPALYFEERDLLDWLQDLHDHQVRNLSFGEYNRAVDKAVQQTLAVGGCVVDLESAAPFFRCAQCGVRLTRQYVEDIGDVCQSCVARERDASLTGEGMAA